MYGTAVEHTRLRPCAQDRVVLRVTVNGHVLLDFTQRAERPQRLRVVSAVLWLHVKQARHPDAWNRSATLYIFRVPPSRNATDPLASMEHLYHLSVSGATGWRRVDLKDAVQRWFSSKPSHKLTLLVDCGGCGPASIRVNQFRGSTRHRPFLAIATEPSFTRRRNRRYTLTCGQGVTQCCKHPLYVSFKEMGWDDWIIAPRGYYANYCVGDCSSPRTPDTFRNFHSQVIEEYRQRNPYASIAPCCAPTKLSSMSLIYFDPDHNIIKTDLPKMIVDECGCT
ncbi:inhibin beta chain-like [Ornithodoros turicata]